MVHYGEKLISMKMLSLLKWPGALQIQATVVPPAQPEERLGNGSSCSQERGDSLRVTFQPFRYFINVLS